MASATGFQGSDLAQTVRSALEDIVSTELMTHAVTLVPCGHNLDESMVIQILNGDRLCPYDRRPIEKHVPNYTLRNLAAHLGAHPDEPPSEEAQRLFMAGKDFSDQGNTEEAVKSFLRALEISPHYEKAQSYLHFCLGISPREPEQPAAPNASTTSSKDSYVDLLLRLLENPLVKQEVAIATILESQLEELMSKDSEALTQKEQDLSRWTQKLLIDGKVSKIVAKKLQEIHQGVSSKAQKPSAAAEATVEQLRREKDAEIQVLTQAVQRMDRYFQDMQAQRDVAAVQARAETEKDLRDFLKTRSFGRTQWMEIIGGISVEPPLPLNLREIMTSPCPFWPGKRVEETHMLVLIPETVCGKPLTLKSLGELIQNPRQGTGTKYSNFDIGIYNDAPNPNSHWALITRMPIPKTEGKSFAEQQAELARYSDIAQIPYDVSSILDTATSLAMENFRVPQNKCSPAYTRCREGYGDTGQLCIEQLPDGSFSFDNQEARASAADEALRNAKNIYDTASGAATNARDLYKYIQETIEQKRLTGTMHVNGYDYVTISRVFSSFEELEKSYIRFKDYTGGSLCQSGELRKAVAIAFRELFERFIPARAELWRTSSAQSTAKPAYDTALATSQKINSSIGIRAQQRL